MSTAPVNTATVTISNPAARCTTCNLIFDCMEAMRTHYNTEFHLHNVRLRVDGKLPIRKGEFMQTIGSAQDEEGGDAPIFHCKLCKKVFHTVQTLQSHVKSTAHLMNKEKRILERDSEAASMLSSTSLGSAAIGLHRRHKAHHREKEIMRAELHPTSALHVSVKARESDVTETSCLFCGYCNSTLEDNLTHMSKIHAFDIPMIHHCSDVKGLLMYMARKINGLMCLMCGIKTRSFDSLEALRAHMESTNHMQIELSPEYQEFYRVTLVDMEAEQEFKLKSAQLVVADGKRIIYKRGPDEFRRTTRETEAQRTERHMITDKKVDEKSLIKQQQYEALAPQRKEQMRIMRKVQAVQSRAMLKEGMRNTKLHPKGYDGEGEMS